MTRGEVAPSAARKPHILPLHGLVLPDAGSRSACYVGAGNVASYADCRAGNTVRSEMRWAAISFSSERERRLWAWTLAVVVAIYSTMGLARTLAGALRDIDTERVEEARAFIEGK